MTKELKELSPYEKGLSLEVSRKGLSEGYEVGSDGERSLC